MDYNVTIQISGQSMWNFLWLIHTIWPLDTWILNIWLHPWMHLLKSYFTHLQTFSFWSKLRPTTRLLFFVFEFLSNVSSRLPWPAVENPFCSCTNKHTNTFFGGITELFPHSDFCSAQCTDVCLDTQMLMFILGYWPWLISDPQERVIWSVCLRLMGVYHFSDRELSWMTLTWHRLIKRFATGMHTYFV